MGLLGRTNCTSEICGHELSQHRTGREAATGSTSVGRGGNPSNGKS